MAPSPDSKVQNGTGKKNGRASRSTSQSAVPIATPPDGGWGWVIVVSSFMISVLVDGVCFSMGIFFNPFREYFNASKGETSWVGSVLNGSYLSVGPVVSALVNRFGCRRVAMVGSVFAACAFFISTFSTSMPLLIITYGLLGGIGFGLVYLPAIVMVGYYFERRRALATGIACCGSGIGAFVFAPLCSFLLELYGWKGATWILSALVLNGFVFSILYRPLEAQPPKKDLSVISSTDVNGEQSVALLAGSDHVHVPPELAKPLADITSLINSNSSLQDEQDGLKGTTVFVTGLQEADSVTRCQNNPPPVHVPVISVELMEPSDSSLGQDAGQKGEPVKDSEDTHRDIVPGDMVLVTSENSVYKVRDLVRTVTPEIHSVITTDSKTYMSDLHLKNPLLHDTQPLARMAFSHDALRPMEIRKRRDHAHQSGPHAHQHQHHLQRQLSTLQVNNPLRRSDIFYSGSLRNLPEFQSSSNIADYRQKVLGFKEAELARKTDFVSPDVVDGESESEEGEWEEEGGVCRRWIIAPLLAVFDVSLLKSPTFVIYGLSCFLCMLGFFVPFMYLPTFGQDLGIDPTKAAFLISIIGIANTVGRVGVGFVSDQPWADCLLINNVALIAGGVATCFVPFLRSYPLLSIYSFVFGTSIAIFVSLRSIIMVELMGLEKLTNAFGLVIMCQGISSYIGAPIAGFLSDITGDYNISFYAAGAVLALGGAICLPLRRIARWENRRQGNGPVDILTEPTVQLDVS